MRPDTLLRYAFALAFVLAGTGWLTTANAQQRTASAAEKAALSDRATLALPGQISARPAGMTRLDDLLRGGGATTPLFEDFTDGIPADWAVFDNGVGTANTWIAFTFSDVGPVVRSNFENVPDDGDPSRDWLATPQVTPTADFSEVTFDAGQLFSGQFGSQLIVQVSTASQTDPADYTTVATFIEDDIAIGALEPLTVDLTAFVGQAIHVAFLHEQDDGDTFIIDNVRLSGIGGSGLPMLAYSPSEIMGSTEVGGTTTETLTITNEGSADLEYSFPRFAAVARLAELASMGIDVNARRPFGELDLAKGVEGTTYGPGNAAQYRVGSDEFGYMFIDSNEEGGPTFDFVDISGTGTATGVGDDEVTDPITLPFGFTLYGEEFNELVISSNGFLAFDTAVGANAGNDPIPSLSTPNGGVIAPFWDDLDAGDNDSGDGGDVYYQDMGDGRFIVQWEMVPRFADTGSDEGDLDQPNTFQAILFENGDVLFQYEDMQAQDLNSASIGIEDETGNFGLGVAVNEAYVENGLAISIMAPADIIADVSPAVGTLAPGASDMVTVTLSAGMKLSEGLYDAGLLLSTNAPDSTSTVIPVSLDVTEGGGGVTIAEARAAGVGATVTVTGTVTRAMGAFTYIQDETAGLTIRQTSGDFFDDVADGTISEGTEVTVTGELSAFAELLQINEGDLTSYTVGATGAVPAPQVVTLQEIVDNGEDYEAELVQVSDLTTDAVGTFAAGTSYDVTDPTASDTLRVPNAADSDIDGTDIPEGEFTFTGVVGQFSFDGPAFGYQLLAIAEGDVEAEGPPGALEFDPSPLVEMLESGQTGTETVTITNNTDSDVAFDFSQYSGEGIDKAPATSNEPSLELAKGEHDPRGYDQSFGAGGPDAFGYEWIDSNEPGGPAFEEIDISGTGTELTEADFIVLAGCTFDPLDEGTATVDLPFDFSFYGETFGEINVNANGVLVFSPSAEPGCWFTNDPLPDPSEPQGGVIAPLWDDFDASPEGEGGGQIFYETLADGRFVVQYNNIERFGGASDGITNTFQVILSPSGAIKYQYGALNDANPSYSIGIENPDGTIGLEVAMGSGYAEEGLAVLIQARPSFVTDVEPATGTIPAGGSVDVDVSFSAEGLNAGTYEGVLNVDTDLETDPSMFELPVELVVTGVAACAITPTTVEFEDTIVGFDTSEEVTVTNGGTAPCSLTSASADAPFSVEGFSEVTLGPGQSTTFTVVYTPTEAGDDSGTLTVETDGDALTAALEGTGLEPPSFSVEPTSLTFEVPMGTISDAQTITLSNTGDGAGTFSIDVANATARGITPNFSPVDPIVTLNSPETAALLSQMARSSVVSARSSTTLTAKTGTQDVRRGGSPGDLLFSASTVASISGFAQTPDGTIYVSDLNAGAQTQMFDTDLNSLGTFTQPGTAGTNITGVTYYRDGDGGNGALWYLNANLNNGTARFVETDLSGTPTGATVPLALPTGAEVPIGLSYNEATGWFFLVDIAGDDILAFNPDGSLVSGYPVPQTCLDDGAGNFGNALDALGNGLDVVVGTSADARPTRVQVTEFDGTCRGDGSGNDLFTPINTAVTEDAFINGVLRNREAPNEVMYLGANSDFTIYAIVPAERDDIGSFLVIEPEAGTVGAGEDQEISVAVDATNLEAGDYSAQIVISTNDPENPTLVVDVDVTVVIEPANEGEGVPTEFALGQNYPNPFVSATTIEYALPEAAHVTITVYDAVGRRVAVLVDQDLTTGYHKAEWDTRGLASGVYLYRIQAGDYVKTKKMSLVR